MCTKRLSRRSCNHKTSQSQQKMFLINHYFKIKCSKKTEIKIQKIKYRNITLKRLTSGTFKVSSLILSFNKIRPQISNKIPSYQNDVVKGQYVTMAEPILEIMGLKQCKCLVQTEWISAEGSLHTNSRILT